MDAQNWPCVVCVCVQVTIVKFPGMCVRGVLLHRAQPHRVLSFAAATSEQPDDEEMAEAFAIAARQLQEYGRRLQEVESRLLQLCRGELPQALEGPLGSPFHQPVDWAVQHQRLVEMKQQSTIHNLDLLRAECQDALTAYMISRGWGANTGAATGW